MLPAKRKIDEDDAVTEDHASNATTNRLTVSFMEKYGDEPDVDAIQADWDAVAPDKLADFVLNRRDEDGKSILHYIGDVDTSNDFETEDLVRRIVEIDNGRAAFLLDDELYLPLYHFRIHLMDCSDDWTTTREGMESDPPQISLESWRHILPAYPEAVFASGLLDELDINIRFKKDLCLPVRQEYVDTLNESYESYEERTAAKVIEGLMRLIFGDGGFHRTPAQQDIQKGLRAPFHIICSYAYEPAFFNLFNWFFEESLAAVPDPSVHGILPLHLVLRSPLLPRPIPRDWDDKTSQIGPIYGFWKMKHREKSIPIEVVKRLVAAFPQALDIPDENGRLPLHLAARHDDSELFDFIYLAGRPQHMMKPDQDGQTPFTIACKSLSLTALYEMMRNDPARVHPANIRQDISGDLGVMTHPSKKCPEIVKIPNQTMGGQWDWSYQAQLKTPCLGVTWSIMASEPECDVNIRPRSGKIVDLCTNTHITHPFQITVIAENEAGWSEITFTVEPARRSNS